LLRVCVPRLRSPLRSSARLDGWPDAVSPTTIAYSGTLLSEIPATLAILAVLLLVADHDEDLGHRLRALFAGLLLSVGILIRPAIAGFGLGLCAWLLLFRSGARFTRILSTGALVAGVVIVLGRCWAYRNYHVLHSLVPVSNNGDFNLYLGNNPHTYNGGWMLLEDELDLRRHEALGAP
jgi:hypothetical protein